MTELRKGLPPLPARMRALAVNDKGYPVPFFVAMIDGKPDFRAADGDKLRRAVRHNLCWVCGEPLGKHQTYVAGPMCGINRVSSEPPSHHECATFAAMACPFMVLPKAQRRDVPDCEGISAPGGIMIERNPGVAMLWTTTHHLIIKRVHNGFLFVLPEPDSVEWYCGGRPATRDEVEHSISTGLPALESMAQQEDAENNNHESMTYLRAQQVAFERWLPKHKFDQRLATPPFAGAPELG